MNNEGARRRVRVIVRGRVQGVAFRAFTADEARRAGVAGWVRNRPDGSVEAVAQATAERLGKLGVQAEVTPQGEAIHINSTIRETGQHFKLILTREKSGNVEKTRIRIEWVGQPNNEMSLQILGRLEHISTPGR